MKLKVNNLSVLADVNNNDIFKIVKEKFRLKDNELNEIIITKKSIDARRDKVKIIYSLVIDVLDYTFKRLIQYKEIEEYKYIKPEINYKEYKDASPIIVGFGPAGMFLSLILARCKANPIILERGDDILERTRKVNEFLINKTLDKNSNLVYGCGGAGTFSDGKLTTNLNDDLNIFILEELVKHGAPKEILYDSKPHIGTDILKKVVTSIKEEIISLGGVIHFNSLFVDFTKKDDVIEVKYIKDENERTITSTRLALCIGHSAYDTVTMLYNKGITITPKAFSMGVRIEHNQKVINKIQHKSYHHLLDNASYKLAVHLKERSLYTFCMCPGGYVVPSTNDDKSIVTNGMSEYKRDNVNANSALLVNVEVEDYYKNSPLDGYIFQRKYERKAFMVSKDFKAPCNLVKEFINNKIATKTRSVEPSYPHGVCFCDFKECLPKFVVDTLKKGLVLMNKKMPGFLDNDALLIGVETRSSSPVRINRDENKMSNISRVYPVGEGAGYAGGIMSAALDGVKTALSIINEEE